MAGADARSIDPTGRIAVVGSGAAGAMCAARLHAAGRRVVLFEKDSEPGGHVRTARVCDPSGVVLSIDLGFIVFNPDSYPNLTRLLAELGVTTQSTEMGLSVELPEGRAWSSASPFADRRLLCDLAHWRMLFGLPQLHRELRGLLEDPSANGESVLDFASRRRLPRVLLDRYLLPMGGAVWSCAPERFGEFPARFLGEFLSNHRMLQIFGRPRWRTVTGGSSVYHERLLAPLRAAGALRLAEPVLAVRRADGGALLRTPRAEERFDEVVLACHLDEAAALLADIDDDERRALAAVPYQRSTVVLHTDPTQMPRARRAWAAWNVRATSAAAAGVSVSYWMNRLQSLDRLGASRDYFVTLGAAAGGIGEEHVLARTEFTHPVYGAERAIAHAGWSRISGRRRTHFAGAGWGWGFHEDAVRSALRVVRALGVEVEVLEVAHAP